MTTDAEAIAPAASQYPDAAQFEAGLLLGHAVQRAAQLNLELRNVQAALGEANARADALEETVTTQHEVLTDQEARIRELVDMLEEERDAHQGTKAPDDADPEPTDPGPEAPPQ